KYREHLLQGPDNTPLNHPANLPQIVRGMAEILDREEQSLRSLLLKNFSSFFRTKPGAKKDAEI
ncbi:MAG: hypothetical protein VX633_05540, partial [Verrucomicrobiota bacterium]|nr:hypothetical protein [Verrucomicrobiota bacterium]